jgi:ubiquinone/menaquinone biosynthesis C-methylase UbiE
MEEITGVRKQWEKAAPGWAKWEPVFEKLTRPATEAMLDMAGVDPGAKVLDLACGAGSQTLKAARRVVPDGQVVASDISETMLQYVVDKANTEQLNNISTINSPAEKLKVPEESFDAAICSIALMLFVNPKQALTSVGNALKPGGKVAFTVFTTPAANVFMAKPMQILLKHAGKKPPSNGEPGIFSLSAPGVVENLLAESGFENPEKNIFPLSLKLSSAVQAMEMLQEAAGAYRAVVSDCSEEVKTAAWNEVAGALKDFETEDGFNASCELLVAGGIKR